MPKEQANSEDPFAVKETKGKLVMGSDTNKTFCSFLGGSMMR